MNLSGASYKHVVTSFFKFGKFLWFLHVVDILCDPFSPIFFFRIPILIGQFHNVVNWRDGALHSAEVRQTRPYTKLTGSRVRPRPAGQVPRKHVKSWGGVTNATHQKTFIFKTETISRPNLISHNIICNNKYQQIYYSNNRNLRNAYLHVAASSWLVRFLVRKSFAKFAVEPVYILQAHMHVIREFSIARDDWDVKLCPFVHWLMWN